MKETADLEKELGERIKASFLVGGGCVAESRKIVLESGRAIFVKLSGKALPPEMLAKEARGLYEIKKSGTVSVPQVLCVHEKFLVLEWVEPTRMPKNFWMEFGRALARLHRFYGPSFGFYEDNFIGLTPQKNTPPLSYDSKKNNWCEFYFENRLLEQFKLAEQHAYVTEEMKILFHRLETKLPKILSGSEELPSLLHGDLWNGNFLCGEQGKAYVVDPAVYYGHREADLAMTKLFGGFDTEFYRAYEETYPLVEGAAYRENVYKLYHVLNHLNLFGMSYFAQAVSLMKY